MDKWYNYMLLIEFSFRETLRNTKTMQPNSFILKLRKVKSNELNTLPAVTLLGSGGFRT